MIYVTNNISQVVPAFLPRMIYAVEFSELNEVVRFATRMVMVGVDFLTLIELLGHKNIKTTMRYAHVIPGRKMEAIMKLANYNK